MGADCVKIYSQDFPPDVISALMDESRKQQLTVGGHLSFMTMTTRDTKVRMFGRQPLRWMIYLTPMSLIIAGRLLLPSSKME